MPPSTETMTYEEAVAIRTEQLHRRPVDPDQAATALLVIQHTRQPMTGKPPKHKGTRPRTKRATTEKPVGDTIETASQGAWARLQTEHAWRS